MVEGEKQSDVTESAARESPGAASGHRAQNPRPHDFRRPRLISDERLKALDTLHRKFARNLSSALATLARARVQVDLVSVSQKTYFDFIRSLPNPTALCLVYHLPQRLPFVLELSPGFLFPLTARLLGGREEAAPAQGRAMTRIEQEIGKTIAGHILRTLEQTWLPQTSVPQAGESTPADGEATIKLDLAEMEQNPLLMQIVGPAEPAVVFQLRSSLGQSGMIQGPFHLCLPSKPFEAILARLARTASPGSSPEHNSPEERERILGRVADTPLCVTAELASVPVALPDALALQPGDVLDLAQGRSDELAIHVDGRRAFRGRPVVNDGRRAVRITRTVEES